MHDQGGGILGPAVLVVLLGGPVLLWLAGVVQRTRNPDKASGQPFDLALLVNSTVLYALAFNLTFFIQELFLVIPKALTPGLRPTLFHNNHTWEGDDPIARLYQGGGTVAAFVSGFLFLLLMRLAPRGVSRLFAFWMAYHGLMMSLPQLPSGVLAPDTDFGQAMTYLHLTQATKIAIALAGLAAMAVAALLLARGVLEQADAEERVGTAKTRSGFIVNAAVLPAIIAIPVIALFRVPASPQTVLAAPILIAWFGVSYMYASAWLFAGVKPLGVRSGVAWPALAALILLLAVFQFVLAPGVRFY